MKSSLMSLLRDLLIVLGFSLLCLSLVWYRAAQALPADFVARTAKVVSIDSNGMAQLKDAENRSFTTKIDGCKVGDEVPVWVTLIGGDIHSVRTGPEPFKPGRNWLYIGIAGTLVSLAGLALPKKGPVPGRGEGDTYR